MKSDRSLWQAMASFARLIRTTRGPWGNVRVSFRIYKRSVLKACETRGVYCSLCAMLSETYRSVGTCFCFVSFFFSPRKARSPLSCYGHGHRRRCLCSISVTLVQLTGVGLFYIPGQRLLCCCFTGEIPNSSFFFFSPAKAVTHVLQVSKKNSCFEVKKTNRNRKEAL